ncbi:MAG: hypothetical protein ACLQFM_20370 [Terriglobales bacterium]|jgi:hypothetical protein
MIKLSQAKKVLETFLKDLLSPLGFSRAAKLEYLEYTRPANEAIASLSWPCRVDPRGFAAFNCIVGLRFESLASWLPTEMIGTVGLPLHLLREDKAFEEWKFSQAEDLPSLRVPILTSLENEALPFIDRYSTLPRLSRAIDGTDDVGLDTTYRVLVRAAIQMVEGNKPAALQILESALAQRVGARPKHRYELERLRDRIAEVPR